MVCVEPSSMIPMESDAIKPLKLDCRGMLGLKDLRYDVLLIIQVTKPNFLIKYYKVLKAKEKVPI